MSIIISVSNSRIRRYFFNTFLFRRKVLEYLNNSGILSGNGTVGNTTVKNGGVIYPTETSTLNVDGKDINIQQIIIKKKAFSICFTSIQIGL